ncbi:6-phosphofructokinase [Pseudobacteriovorax antillogorgiicola]|uniref:ATP-dependent 6-phosphofructokinase n=1 Tax=Pseudobacteriovorax antillogorgiicola TaxID=1513793 RepID=A0A1Y6B6J7_9BACT|nr:6-phosphofructokinase [Pseudobacteriovorax antillogorgiicola]TCS58896.1 6-phosphofructokinase [Pseudobacteriovorax antillogorgiicola]SME93432.1 6-phosphofructokinase [Pseudobacteriovorax antillogorgiicola]
MGRNNAIAVLCSGGDGPGMNSAIRSVVRTGISEGYDVYGVYKGFAGLLTDDFEKMDLSSVGNIIQRGGTVLYTSRCAEFHDPEARKVAAENLKKRGIGSLIVIGGNGSFQGANCLFKEHDIKIICIPGTIDNDISGTEYTIGFDTALHTAVEAIDKIRDTATSHDRTFLVEVMGRSSGMIAITVAISTGAECVIFPEQVESLDDVAANIKRGIERGKKSSIIIVAEGDHEGLGYSYQKDLKSKYGLATKLCILGHIQRGGNPSPRDRFSAARMGYMAVESIKRGDSGKVTVVRDGKFCLAPLEECLEKKNDFDPELLEILRTLAL